jgi:hypothetical protein
MKFVKIITVYSENHTTPINTKRTVTGKCLCVGGDSGVYTPIFEVMCQPLLRRWPTTDYVE